jgi:flagellar hook-associated protein 2
MASVSGVGNTTGLATTSSNGSPLNFTGLASGLDTTSIINSLTALDSQYIQQLTQNQTTLQTQQSTFNDISSKLQALQTAVEALTNSVSGPFDSHTVTSSNPSAVTAAASSTAVAGQYTFTVGALANANQIASQGFSSPSDTIKQGTLTLQVGSSAAVTVTIDSTNNTVQGLANAINAAGGNVSAAVINDGSSTPYRLLLTSGSTGAANDIQVTNNLTSGTGAAIDPTNTTVQAGTDAQVTIGSGSGAITIHSASNTVDGVIPGVTLNLLQANPSQPITLTVANDSTGATTAVQSFVTAYNAVIDDINQNDSYDPTSKTAGDLLGNFTVENLSQSLAGIVTQTIGSVNPQLNNLTDIGLSFNDTGDLQFDSSQLQKVLNGQVPGVGASDVKALFALAGKSTNTGISFVLGGANTKPSGSTPYQVQATQAATQGSITATNALGPTTTIDNTNNTFSVAVNGAQSGPLTIAAGSYTAAQLASSIQAAIDSDAKLAGANVSVGVNNNQLQITSQLYGRSSTVAIGTGTAITSGILGFSGTENGTGQDVAGYFLVNGNIETATGFGQILSGNSGNANTDGLEVQVTLTPPQITNTPEASLTVSNGVAQQLNQTLNQYLTPITGVLATVNTQLNSQISDISNSITNQNNLLQGKISSLQSQFSAMEVTLSTLNALSQQLAVQFASIPVIGGTLTSSGTNVPTKLSY